MLKGPPWPATRATDARVAVVPHGVVRQRATLPTDGGAAAEESPHARGQAEGVEAETIPDLDDQIDPLVPPSARAATP